MMKSPDLLASIASNAFHLEDQEQFALFSGDYNPMHLSIKASRRSQAGAPAVYGMLQVLWALDHLRELVPASMHIANLRARFQHFVLVGEEAHLTVSGHTEDTIRLNITVCGVVCTNLIVSLEGGQLDFSDQEPDGPCATAEPSDCRILTVDEVEHLTGDLPVNIGPLNARLEFPGAAGLVGATRVRAIAALSRLVGMVCPGLHSMFSSMNIRLVRTDSSRLRYAVKTVDGRFSFLRQTVAGAGIEGSIDAFLRTPPTEQPSAATIQRLLTPGEFSRARALVVGGSRGLGEFTAKTIGAGGGHVVATYRIGREEGEAVANQIRACGGTCDLLSYDVLKPVAPQLESLPLMPTSLYYFATNKIFARSRDLFDGERFSQFTEVYVNGFFNLCSHLKEIGVERLVVFYPSSVALESRPADMAAYAMAKAAGEVLCDEISRRWPKFRMITHRLPRLVTDQTATVLDVEPASVEDVLLPIIREVEGTSSR